MGREILTRSVAVRWEKARSDSERQQVYLESFVRPVLPQEAEFPRRSFLISLVFGGSFLIWFLITWVALARLELTGGICRIGRPRYRPPRRRA